jgi:hypothetical protein
MAMIIMNSGWRVATGDLWPHTVTA